MHFTGVRNVRTCKVQIFCPSVFLLLVVYLPDKAVNQHMSQGGQIALGMSLQGVGEDTGNGENR